MRDRRILMAHQQPSLKKEGPVAHVLPPLPYASDALEPYIDKMTMEIHHGKHHNAYVNNLNKALDGNSALQAKSLYDLLRSLDQVPEKIRGAVQNNGGGHWNHLVVLSIFNQVGRGLAKGLLAPA